jgi:hypothetical protein
MIAYFILVHRYPLQFKRLFRAIYDSENHYLIHVDKKAGPDLLKDIKRFLKDFPNTSILKSQSVVWGGYSMVETELRGIKRLLEISKVWTHFINLSGQDFPLKTQKEIKDLLRVGKGKDYMLVSDQTKDRPNTLNRIKNYFVESDSGFTGTPVKRPFMANVIPYIGGQWKILSRNACEFICSDSKVTRIKNFYKNTLIPDESFFQTALMNSDYPNSIINDDKRAIIWIPDVDVRLNPKTLTAIDTESLIASGKIKLRPKTFTLQDRIYLSETTAFFARKFDETVDSAILDFLEANLKMLNHPKKLKVNLGLDKILPLPIITTITPARII